MSQEDIRWKQRFANYESAFLLKGGLVGLSPTLTHQELKSHIDRVGVPFYKTI
ncbi:MAG: hypothetical protein IPQ05_09390 [Leptospiraceae bacterium]|nr:hypothetical protein [Leptospiraceae bacterium]